MGIVLGQAFKKALGDKKGIKRFGSASVPMEDVVAKMRRRKPYVFEGKQVTIEEAGRLWEEVKRKEKINKAKEV